MAHDPPVDRRATMSDKEEVLARGAQEQETLITRGQQHINLLWESTQALIAITITFAVIYCAVFALPSIEVLTNAFFLIIGFYFSRTNHTAIGGVGHKPTDRQPYVGR